MRKIDAKIVRQTLSMYRDYKYREQVLNEEIEDINQRLYQSSVHGIDYQRIPTGGSYNCPPDTFMIAMIDEKTGIERELDANFRYLERLDGYFSKLPAWVSHKFREGIPWDEVSKSEGISRQALEKKLLQALIEL